MKQLVFATTNAGKLKELRELVPGFEIVPGPALEVVEDADTFEGNAEKKARAYLAATGLPSLADDSGLCVDALDGRPGVFSARYAPTEAERIARLLRELEGATVRTARFRCALCLALPDGTFQRADGACEGEILRAPRGTAGFGYDPVFFMPSLDKTMAELTSNEKSAVSHRGNAMRALALKLSSP